MQAQTGPGEAPCGAWLNLSCPIVISDMSRPRISQDLGRGGRSHLHSCSELLRLRCCLTVLVTRTPGWDTMRGAEMKTWPNLKVPVHWTGPSRKSPVLATPPLEQARELHSLQLSGMTFRAKGTKSSKEASRITALMSG